MKDVKGSSDCPRDVHLALPERGLLHNFVPEEIGGSSLGHLSRTILIEERARTSAAVSMIQMVNELGCTPILIAGGPEQKREFAAPEARGGPFVSYHLTEPEAGSDVPSVSTMAERDGDDWVLNGKKAWICNVRARLLHRLYTSHGLVLLPENSTEGGEGGHVPLKRSWPATAWSISILFACSRCA